MDFLKTHVFFAFFIGISYFIMKAFFRRIYKDTEMDTKQVSKDSFLIFFITYLGLILRSNLFAVENIKTQVFTSEPNF